MSNPRVRLKRMVEAAAGAPALVRYRLRQFRGRAFILAWHNIVPAGESAAGERSLHTDQKAFGEQLDAVAELLPIVPLRRVLDASVEEPVAVITFDDAYAGTLAAGGEELSRRGLTGTVFVAPAFLGGRTFWWDAFADPATGELAETVRETALNDWQGDDGRIREELAARGREPAGLPAHAACATETDLRAAVDAGPFEAGSHTWSHRNQGALDAGARAGERELAVRWLAERFDAVPALALPYGLGSAHAAEADEDGCRAVLRIEGGWAKPAPGFQVLPRFNVPRGLSAGGLRLRLAGLLE